MEFELNPASLTSRASPGLLKIAPLSPEMALNSIGEHVLGLSRFC